MKVLLKYKVTLIVILVIALVGYFGYSYYIDSTTIKVKIQTAKVEKSNVIRSVSATGTVQPVNSVDVSSKITGRIVDVKVKENDWVNEGQVLFVLDDQQYKSEVSRTEATLSNSKAIFERQRRLLEQGAVAKQDYDVAEKDYLVAKAAYETAVSNLNDTVITAPVTGLVIGKPTPAGQTVAPGISTPMVLMTIADMSIMQSETLVDETDIGYIKLNQEVEFTVDTYTEKVFHGKVSLISRKVEQDNNINYYKVYVDVIDSEEGELFPDMTSRVIILLDRVDNVLCVPLSSVKYTDKGSFVYLITSNGKTKEVEVEIGLKGDEKVEVKSGVNEGDEVLLRATANAAVSQTVQKTPRF